MQANEFDRLDRAATWADAVVALNELPVAARIVDSRSLHYLAVNPASCELYGYSQEEFLALDIEDLVLPEDLSRARAIVQASDSGTLGEWRHLRKDGSVIDVELVTRPIRVNGESVTLLISIDRTEEARTRRLREETQRRLVAVTEGVRDALFMLDQEYRFTYVNRNCFPSLRRPPGELIGKVIWDELPHVSTAWYRPLYDKVMLDRIPMHFEAEGTYGWYDVDVFPAADGIAVAYRDITERKRDEERKSFLFDFSDRIRSFDHPEGLMTEAVSLISQFFCAKRCAYYEIEPSGLVTMHGAPATPGIAYGPFERDLFEAMGDGRPLVVNDARQSPHARGHLDTLGAWGVYAFACAPVVSAGRLAGALFVGATEPRVWDPNDVSLLETLIERTTQALQHTRSQQEIRRLNEDLESRVRERTAELQAAKDDMEGFCYSVSHDLRSPLRAMMANARLLVDENRESLDEEATERLERLARSAKRMGDLIDDLLQFSRLGRTALSRSRIDISEIAQQLAQELTDRNPGRKITFRIEPKLEAYADGQLIRLVLQNLLENAVKFSRTRPEAEIEFGREDGEFYVRDNGVGFDYQYVHKLFRPFERLHREEDYPGTGIGLANVSRIIERHGGKVRAESEIDKGATFFFRLLGG